MKMRKKQQRQQSRIVDRLSAEIELDDGRKGSLTRNQISFLKAFRIAKTINGTCDLAGFNRLTHYRWCKESDFYRAAYHEVKEAAADDLEEAATGRAIDGVRTIKFTKTGTPVRDPRKHDAAGKVKPEWEHDPWYYESTYSDRLLELLLKAKKPDEYRERSSIEMSGAGGGAIEVEVAARQMMLANPTLSQQMSDVLEGVLNEQSHIGSPVAALDDLHAADLGLDDQQRAVLAGPPPDLHQPEAGGSGGGENQTPDDLLPSQAREE